MTTTAHQDRLQRSLDDLKTLRDEVRLDLHLAGLDLRDEWRALERRIPNSSTVADELKEATTAWLEELTNELRVFRDRLRERRDQPRT